MQLFGSHPSERQTQLALREVEGFAQPVSQI